MSTVNIKERHIDRLLSEELESSRSFALWFCQRVFQEAPPTERPDNCVTTISYHRESGETDIRVQMEWQSGYTGIIHIEDKIGAMPQPDQANRYLMAIEQEKIKLAEAGKQGMAECVLVCPGSWLLRYPRESGIYPVSVTFEEIANEFKRRAEGMGEGADEYQEEIRQRLLWRSRLLDGSSARKAVYSKIEDGDITEWNECAAEIIRAENGLALDVRPRLRTPDGLHKTSRFFRFDESLLPYNQNVPVLKLKTSSETNPGRVSLEVPNTGDDQELRTEAEARGYNVSSTVKGTLMIDSTTERLQVLDIGNPVAEQVDGLKDVAEVALDMINWWESRN